MDSRNLCKQDRISQINGELVQSSSLPIATGDIVITDSSNIHFGHNTYFNGPVTIIQSKSAADNPELIKTEVAPSSSSKGYKDDSDSNDDLVIARSHLRIVPRCDWVAEPPSAPLDVIQKPVPWVIITHTATEGCTVQSECVLRVRLLQTFHKESRKWFDIGYNFLVGGDGSVYQGRGWDAVGAHTKGYNYNSIAIAFIGTFNTEVPPQRQFNACQKLIKLGVDSGELAKDYKLFAHRQLMSTLSPGQAIYDVIKEWPHFVKNPTVDDLEINLGKVLL